jgi:hypothetical protein
MASDNDHTAKNKQRQTLFFEKKMGSKLALYINMTCLATDGARLTPAMRHSSPPPQLKFRVGRRHQDVNNINSCNGLENVHDHRYRSSITIFIHDAELEVTIIFELNLIGPRCLALICTSDHTLLR